MFCDLCRIIFLGCWLILSLGCAVAQIADTAAPEIITEITIDAADMTEGSDSLGDAIEADLPRQVMPEPSDTDPDLDINPSPDSGNSPSPYPFLTRFWTESENDGVSITYNLGVGARVLGVIPVRGRASFDAQLWPSHYQIDSAFYLTGLAGLFVKYRLKQTTQGVVSQSGLTPVSHSSETFDDKTNPLITVVFSHDTVTIERIPRYSNVQAPKTSLAQKLASVDPLTALLTLMLASPNEPGGDCGPDVQIFDGLFVSSIGFTHLGDAEISSGLGRVVTQACGADIAVLSAQGAPSDVTQDFDDMRVQFTTLDNGLRVPAHMSLDTERIGRVQFKVLDFQINPITPPAVKAQ